MKLVLLAPGSARLSSCRTARDCRTPSSEPRAYTLSGYAAAIWASASFLTSAQGENVMKAAFACSKLVWIVPLMLQ
jgi:hypothetical protein